MKCINLVTPTSLSEDNLSILLSIMAFLHTLDEYSIFWSFYSHPEFKHSKSSVDKLAYLVTNSGLTKSICIDFFNCPELAIVCSLCKGRKINFEKVNLVFLEDYPVVSTAASIINLIRILDINTSFLTFNTRFESEDLIRLISLEDNNWSSLLISSLLLEASFIEKPRTKDQTSISDKSLFWLCTKCFKGKNNIIFSSTKQKGSM
jgi:hypothetical protein